MWSSSRSPGCRRCWGWAADPAQASWDLPALGHLNQEVIEADVDRSPRAAAPDGPRPTEARSDAPVGPLQPAHVGLTAVEPDPAELTMWAMGRTAAARVRFDGSEADVGRLERADWRV